MRTHVFPKKTDSSEEEALRPPLLPNAMRGFDAPVAENDATAMLPALNGTAGAVLATPYPAAVGHRIDQIAIFPPDRSPGPADDLAVDQNLLPTRSLPADPLAAESSCAAVASEAPPDVSELWDPMTDIAALDEQAAEAPDTPALPENLPDVLDPLVAIITGTATEPASDDALAGSETGASEQLSAALPAAEAETAVQAQPQASTQLAVDPDYAWRVAEDPSIQPLIAEMLDRLQPYNDITLRGQTPESALRRFILRNRAISNAQLRAMTRATLEKMADTPEACKETLHRFPNHQKHPAHRFAVALLVAVTGKSDKEISNNIPSLGVTGTPRRFLGLVQVFYVSDSPYVQLSTALHDFTDTMRQAEVEGINEAVWGIEGQVPSAIVSWFWALSEWIQDLISDVGTALLEAADAVVDQVQNWLGCVGSWFTRFAHWLLGN